MIAASKESYEIITRSIDAIYIRLKDSQIIESEAIAPNIICDFDRNEQIIGLEILQFQQQTPEQLSLINSSFTEDDRQQLKEILNRLTKILV